MKKITLFAISSLVLFSCAPVLNRDLMKQGAREVSLSLLRENPDGYKGKLFILGGVIVETRFTATGSQIESLYVRVDSYGYLKDIRHADGRFLAIYPRSRGLLDPVVYKKGREITIAGEFLETRKGKIDEMEYTYPVFEIRQIYLWEERRDHYYVPYYPYPYWWYDPWWWGRPYPPYWYGPPPGW